VELDKLLCTSRLCPGVYPGDARFLTNMAGMVTDTYQFDAFGNQIAGTGTTANNFLYSGKQFDNSTGLYYLRARYYRMPTGRFLTIDPYQGTILDPASLHKYVYTGNNPVNLIDPTGLDAIDEYAALREGAAKRYIRKGLSAATLCGRILIQSKELVTMTIVQDGRSMGSWDQWSLYAAITLSP